MLMCKLHMCKYCEICDRVSVVCGVGVYLVRGVEGDTLLHHLL